MCARHVVTALLAAALAACGPSPASDPASTPPAPATTAPPPATGERPKIVFLGDSLTAGLGLSRAEAFPAHIDARLRADGFDAEVVNAGVSGDTAAGGRRRLDWALDGDVRVLVLALGANDGLRGNSVPAMKADLEAIIRAARARGAAVLLLGMEAPPNFGREYTLEFRRAFRDLAGEEDVAFVPFFLDGVAGEAALNQGDGLHPNAEGARRIADSVWEALEPLVEAHVPRAAAGAGR